MNNNPERYPKIEYGFRLEGIVYRLETKFAEVDSTWINGRRIYPDTLRRWSDQTIIAEEEKEIILNDILKYLEQKNDRPIVVINVDDASKNVIEQICVKWQSFIISKEYTSDEKEYKFQYEMYMDILRGGGAIIDGEKEIKSKEEIELMIKGNIKRKRVG